ncbi:MAG: hypothetical protein LBT00_07145 [Spirochaetaceae bacterium]|jgi:hypothetical protein|nr:hypothetical protein [Spirochaetaceae bacterium]
MARARFRLTPARKSLAYLVLAVVVIMLFRLIVPGGDPPVKPFLTTWRLLRGILTVADWFPALILSAFVVPFAYRVKEEEDKVFIPGNIASLTASLIRAVVASCIYGLLLFFVTPFASDALDNMQAQTVLYNKSRAAVRSLLYEGGAPGALTDSEISQARQFLAVCDSIWPEKNDVAAEREAVYAEAEQRKLKTSGDNGTATESPSLRSFTGQRQPVNATEALRFASTAMEEKRYYDAHWLAGLAGRLAPSGSVEQNAAGRLAAQAWAALERFEPSADNIRAHENYRLKRAGYEAMTAQDWIRAYYVFLELKTLTPNDPDLEHFIAKCEEGIRSSAFFTDEVSMMSPFLKTDAVFSIPRAEWGGRLVFRAGSISVFDDAAYVLDIEILGFDALRRPVYSVTAPYARILPITIGGRAKSVISMRALDRHNKDLRWEPVWEGRGEARLDGNAPPGGENDRIGDAELVIDMAYEDILIATSAIQGGAGIGTGSGGAGNSATEIGDTNYRFASLHAAVNRLPDYGFIPELFSVLEIRSIAEPLMLLPLSIFAIILGWRYRVRTRRARYVLFPMLVVLPIVFNTLVHLFRHLNNSFAVWAVLSFGLSVAIALSVGIAAVLFIIAVVVLAYQKEH